MPGLYIFGGGRVEWHSFEQYSLTFSQRLPGENEREIAPPFDAVDGAEGEFREMKVPSDGVSP